MITFHIFCFSGMIHDSLIYPVFHIYFDVRNVLHVKFMFVNQNIVCIPDSKL
jgi:hypothetical protein